MATGWTNYSSTSGGQNSNFTINTTTTTAWDMMKLGKRHELTETPTTTVAKRNKPSWPASVGVTCLSSPVVARCQVEGCHVALCNAKEYYRKHKVCEIHSKAPKVTVLGLQQRFCQQCSRFHGVTEFDEAKRSCRRQLKGHNQRRRKGSLSNPHSMKDERRLEPISASLPLQLKPGCALTFLSSPISEPWNCSGHEFSSRCSSSYEIMAGNNRGSYGYVCHQPVSDSDNDNRNDREIKQQISPGLEVGVLSKSNDGEEWTDYCWSTFGGANVV